MVIYIEAWDPYTPEYDDYPSELWLVCDTYDVDPDTLPPGEEAITDYLYTHHYESTVEMFRSMADGLAYPNPERQAEHSIEHAARILAACQ